MLRRPPFAPAAFWCTRLMVLSRLCQSAWLSRLSVANNRRHLPFFDHRSKRLNTVFHDPNSRGRSRHGTPVRRHQSTASMNLRSSLPRRPTPRSRTRNSFTTRHCWSFSVMRMAIPCRAHSSDLFANFRPRPRTRQRPTFAFATAFAPKFRDAPTRPSAVSHAVLVLSALHAPVRPGGRATPSAGVKDRCCPATSLSHASPLVSQKETDKEPRKQGTQERGR
jgi:hypothetical protein